MPTWLPWTKRTKRTNEVAGLARRAGAASAGGARPAPPAAVLSESVVVVPGGDAWALAMFDRAERRGDVLTELPTR